MVGNLLAQARKDAKHVVTKLGFQNDVFLINNLSMNFIQLKGLTSKHWLQFDSDGSPINAKNVHLNLIEKDIQELGFETRGKNGNVNLLAAKNPVVWATNDASHIRPGWSAARPAAARQSPAAATRPQRFVRPAPRHHKSRPAAHFSHPQSFPAPAAYRMPLADSR